MFCYFCGKENKDEQNFCKYCGKSLHPKKRENATVDEEKKNGAVYDAPVEDESEIETAIESEKETDSRAKEEAVIEIEQPGEEKPVIESEISDKSVENSNISLEAVEPTSIVEAKKASKGSSINKLLIAVIILLAVLLITVGVFLFTYLKTGSLNPLDLFGENREEIYEAETSFSNNDETDSAIMEEADEKETERAEEIIEEETADDSISEPVETEIDEVHLNDSDWQESYKSVLQDSINGKLAKNEPVKYYYVYDIDKDDIPELIVGFGEDEASNHGQVYKYDTTKGRAIQIGDIGLGHSVLYTYPEGNGILQSMAHMDGQTINKFFIDNGEIKEEELFSEVIDFNNEDEWYTDVDKVVNGAVCLDETDPLNDSSIMGYREYVKKIAAGKTENRHDHEVLDENDDYILPDSSDKRLEKNDIKGFSEEQCRIARNEIYARHGRKFKDEQLQEYFNNKSWYKGTTEPDDFNEKELNKIELDNINLITDYEKEMGYSRLSVISVEASSVLKTTSKDNATYIAGNVSDGNYKTAWVEGVDGNGEGQILVLHLDGTHKISRLKIYNGYLKTKRRYAINGKVTSAMIDYGNGHQQLVNLNTMNLPEEESDFSFGELGETEIIPDGECETDTIIVTIMGAVAGSKYTDTCISEIEVFGK